MEIIELNPEYFKQMIVKPAALIDFYATWCGPGSNFLYQRSLTNEKTQKRIP